MKYLLIVALTLFISCNPINQRQASINDSLGGRTESEIKDSLLKSIKRESLDRVFFNDTNKLQNAPVKVLSAHPVQEEYSNYKDISVYYKNVSGKNISAIKFRWYGLNAFGDPADMGSISDYTAGIGSGFMDDPLKAGSTRTSEWSLLSKDLKKVVSAWPYEVVFEDGTKWEIKD